MRSVGVYEAKTHLPRLIEEVGRGESITITKHGRPVAVLAPPAAVPRADVDQIIEQMIALREATELAPGPSIKEMIAEGRR